ncbi:NAD(P)/FAD-dependent oxidoreductase [Streptomyces apocyni]|uniref:NAD(P)/FAD-dependent oxidoreductase n=1 Tax=Streptomyces apocyni TaxID=2654677 RepID=UPI0012EA0D5B|nr:FAD-dependent oxidoreductase [Streptomyces apocyni]
MTSPRVVVVGAGQGGLETAAALRGRGFSGRITLVGDECVLPYQRPPLSKGFLTGATGATDPADLELRPASFFATQGIDLVPGDRAERIDRECRVLHLESGAALPYDHLVLATGARPRPLPVPGAGLSGVLALRGLRDAHTLRRELSGPARHLVVVGAGFIGLELAATARTLGHEVTVVEAQSRALARALTPEMSAWLTDEHRRQGVRLLLSREVAALHGDPSGQVEIMELDGGERIPAELVVVGIGVLPHTELAAEADLVVGDGIVVDERLRTSDPAIHAVGDCARFPRPGARGHTRIESVQNASDQARCVAADICGEGAPYTAVPWFWSEQYAVRLQIAGLTAGHDEVVLAGDPGEARFSVFCFQAGRLVGVESVNRPADHGIARRLLAGGTDLSPEEVGAPGFDLKQYQRAPAPAPAPAPVTAPRERPVHVAHA